MPHTEARKFELQPHSSVCSRLGKQTCQPLHYTSPLNMTGTHLLWLCGSEIGNLSKWKDRLGSPRRMVRASLSSHRIRILAQHKLRYTIPASFCEHKYVSVSVYFTFFVKQVINSPLTQKAWLHFKPYRHVDYNNCSCRSFYPENVLQSIFVTHLFQSKSP